MPEEGQIVLNKVRETKNKVLFEGGNPAAGVDNIYVNKSFFKGTIPDSITITITS